MTTITCKHFVADRSGKILREARDADEVLRDGEVLLTRMGRGMPLNMVFDSVGKLVPIADALASHRPGYRLPSTDAADRADGAYAARKRLLAGGWRGPGRAA